MAEVKRRTFEAKKHPRFSAARDRLNQHALTSEYMTSYRYVIVLANGKSAGTFTTKSAAELALPSFKKSEEG